MEVLKPYRDQIDALDDQIVDLLARRLEIVNEVAMLKAARGIPAVLEDRVEEVIERCAARARDEGMDPELVRRVFAVIVAYCCDREDIYIRSKKAVGM